MFGMFWSGLGQGRQFDDCIEGLGWVSYDLTCRSILQLVEIVRNFLLAGYVQNPSEDDVPSDFVAVWKVRWMCSTVERFCVGARSYSVGHGYFQWIFEEVRSKTKIYQ